MGLWSTILTTFWYVSFHASQHSMLSCSPSMLDLIRPSNMSSREIFVLHLLMISLLTWQIEIRRSKIFNNLKTVDNSILLCLIKTMHLNQLVLWLLLKHSGYWAKHFCSKGMVEIRNCLRLYKSHLHFVKVYALSMVALGFKLILSREKLGYELRTCLFGTRIIASWFFFFLCSKYLPQQAGKSLPTLVMFRVNPNHANRV